MKKVLFILFSLFSIIYLLVCISIYYHQENLIYFPKYLDSNYKFQFSQPFEEKYITTSDSVKLHGVLFKTQAPKGLIFFLHGNAGCVDKWDNTASLYNSLGYDFFILDYRGYGKSGGKIESETQLHADVGMVYKNIMSNYKKSDIYVIGYSLGSCMATKLALETKPKKLILLAPYYSMTYMMETKYPFLPTFLLKYKLETYKYIQECKMPIAIFHGYDDDVINVKSSILLKNKLKATDTLILLEGQDHLNISKNETYLKYVRQMLD